MQITRALIVRHRGGPDRIFLDTDLPCGAHPFIGTQDLSFDVARGTGEGYLATHFPEVPIAEVIEAEVSGGYKVKKPEGW